MHLIDAHRLAHLGKKVLRRGYGGGRGFADPEMQPVTKGKIYNFSSIFSAYFGTLKEVCCMAGQAKSKITDQTEVTVSELAVVLGLSSRRIRQLADEGVIHAVGKNAYLLADTVQSYNKFLSTKLPTDEETKLEKAKRLAETQIKASKATIAKLQAQELQGKMHRSEDVAAMTADLIYEMRGALIALPGRLAVDVAALSTPAECSERIRREAHLIMRELANYKYDPAKYAERVRERMDWDSAGQADADDDE